MSRGTEGNFNMDQMTLGEFLKKQGRDKVENNAGEWMGWIRREAILIAARNGTVTSSDLREVANRHDRQPHHPNAWGSVFRGKGWKLVGYEKSTVPSAHARRIAIWAYEG